MDSQYLTVGVRHAFERTFERRHELSQLAVVRGILARALGESLGIRSAIRQRSRELRFVRQDPDEPGHELACRIETLRVLDRREEGRLDEVLGLRLVPDQVPGHLEELRGREVEHLRERIEIGFAAVALEEFDQSGLVHVLLLQGARLRRYRIPGTDRGESISTLPVLPRRVALTRKYPNRERWSPRRPPNRGPSRFCQRSFGQANSPLESRCKAKRAHSNGTCANEGATLQEISSAHTSTNPCASRARRKGPITAISWIAHAPQDAA